MSQAIMPKFGIDRKETKPQRTFTEEQALEALLIAAWREGRYEVIQSMINARSELQLIWTDPMFDNDIVEG